MTEEVDLENIPVVAHFRRAGQMTSRAFWTLRSAALWWQLNENDPDVELLKVTMTHNAAESALVRSL